MVIVHVNHYFVKLKISFIWRKTPYLKFTFTRYIMKNLLTDKDVKSTLHLTGELDDKDVKSTLNLIGEKCSLTESSTKLNLNVIEKVFIAVLESQNFIL